MLTNEDRRTLLRILDVLDADDARFVVDLALKGHVLERALRAAARDFRRLRRRPRHPVPRVGQN